MPLCMLKMRISYPLDLANSTVILASAETWTVALDPHLFCWREREEEIHGQCGQEEQTTKNLTCVQTEREANRRLLVKSMARHELGQRRTNSPRDSTNSGIHASWTFQLERKIWGMTKRNGVPGEISQRQSWTQTHTHGTPTHTYVQSADCKQLYCHIVHENIWTGICHLFPKALFSPSTVTSM